MAASTPPCWDEIEELSPIDSPSKILNDSYIPEDDTDVLIMDIEIGDGRHDEIRVKEGQLPQHVAYEFCKKHELSYTIQTALAGNIENNLKLAQLSMEQYPETSCDISSQIMQVSKRSVYKDIGTSPRSMHIPKINENSKRMLKGKVKGNVYERLHRQTSKSKMGTSSESVELSIKKVNLTVNGIHYGQKLYNTGLIKKSQTESYLKAVRENQIKDVSKGATFTPKNNYRINISRDPFKPEAFIAKEKLKDLNLENLKKGEIYLETSGCTFNSQICPKTKLNSTLKIRDDKETDRFNTLHKDSEIRFQKQHLESKMILKTPCSFKPDASYNNSYNKNQSQTSGNKINRLISSRKAIEEYLAKQRSQIGQLKDPHTGQNFFKPRTDHLTKKRELEGKNVCEDLYAYRNNSKAHKIKTSRSTERNRQTEDLVKKIKHERFMELFMLLNPSSEGLISYSTIDRSKIPDNIYNIISPVLLELKEFPQTLNFEDFNLTMDDLLKHLAISDKKIILKPIPHMHQKLEAPQITYKPVIIPYTKPSPQSSDKSCISFISNSSSKPAYERLLQYKIQSEQKLEVERMKQFISSESDCNFKPNVSKCLNDRYAYSSKDTVECNKYSGSTSVSFIPTKSTYSNML